MKIVIFSGYNNNFGDLNFGKKLIAFVKDAYPDAEIQLVTSSTDILKSIINGLNNLEKFNQGSDYRFLPSDEYLRSEQQPPDLLLVGPTLNMEVDVFCDLAPNTNTPIVLMSEYDFPPMHMEDRTEELENIGYTNVTKLPTGLRTKNESGPPSQGIFIDESAVNFKKDDSTQVNQIFNSGLEKTGQVILEGQSPTDYLANTNVAVNYSHNNAERFLTVHALMSDPEKNTDVIIMGEESEGKKKDRPILEKIGQQLIEKGFGKIIYEEIGKPPEIIAQSENGGPTYRVIHTGRVSSQESANLRKIGGDFSGATGDQSYSEAIASSSMVIYECQSWKKGLVEGMISVANSIDNSGRLARAVELLAFAKNDEEYKELAELLKNPDIRDNFKVYRKAIVEEKNFSKRFLEELLIHSMPFKTLLNDSKDNFITKLSLLNNSKVNEVLAKQGLRDLYELARALESKVAGGNKNEKSYYVTLNLLKMVKSEFNQRIAKSTELPIIKGNANSFLETNKSQLKTSRFSFNTLFNFKSSTNYIKLYENHLKYLETQEKKDVLPEMIRKPR